jgi:hypothetical protein
MLKEHFRSAFIYNASAPHYTLLHMYHRFVLDLVHGLRPQVLLLTSAANDTLSFVHHKNGFVSPDHSHYYKAWVSQQEAYRFIRRLPTSTLKFVAAFMAYRRSRPAWEEVIEDLSHMPTQKDRAENTRITRELFSVKNYLSILQLFRTTCQAYGVHLALCTFATNKLDMVDEPRETYEWGISQFNQVVREFAKTHGLTLIDFEREAHLGPDDIENKWHFLKSGNLKRTNLVVQKLSVDEKTPSIHPVEMNH